MARIRNREGHARRSAISAASLARLFFNFCAELLRPVDPKLRRVARINLAFALPELATGSSRARNQRRFPRHRPPFARNEPLSGYRQKQTFDRWIRYEGLEHYLAAKVEGARRTGRDGASRNWELSAFAHAIMTEPMNVMVRPLDNPYVNRLVETRRQLSGNQLIVKRDSALTVVRALRIMKRSAC